MDEDVAQTYQQFVDQLHVTQRYIPVHLKGLEKIQDIWKKVPHELGEKQQETRKSFVQCCSLGAKDS